MNTCDNLHNIFKAMGYFKKPQWNISAIANLRGGLQVLLGMICVFNAQIYNWDPRPNILLHLMVSSAMGIFGFLSTTYTKTNAKQVRPRSSRTMWHFTRYLHTHSDCSRCKWHWHKQLRNNDYFDYEKKPKDIHFEPRIPKVLDLHCISVV